jgi:hypothetical protein
MVTIIRAKPGAAPAEECFEAMRRHNRLAASTALRNGIGHAVRLPPVPPGGSGAPPGQASPAEGDILYGAKAIARFIFGDDGNRSRRRVFNLWAHYRDRKEKAGFFKLKGALCLSKSQWRGFHGLG